MRRLRGEFFEVDRWLSSSAVGLPLEARGLYREMLSRAWLLGAQLPNDPIQIQRLVGITSAEWRRTWPLVRGYWRVDGPRLVNDTQREIYGQAVARQAKAHRAAFVRHGAGGAR